MNEELNFNEISQMIEIRKSNAYRKVNEELIGLYWDFGKYISEKIKLEKWGSKTIEKLANFMKGNYPTLKGFNKRGIYRMKQFYDTYKDNQIVSTLLTQLSWSNHIQILSSAKTMEERIFYIKLAIKERYSARELARQLDSAYYQRYLLSDGKAQPLRNLSIEQDKYLNTKILDTYTLEFLDLPQEYSERDFRKAIISNLKSFILEIGKDFTFIGEEYRIQVGNEDFYIDLLFYNRTLSCLVAFELKIGKFKPEYISKMDFYLEALDRQEKKKNENPSVGIILCSSKDEKVVEYTMSRTMSPTLVSEYKLNLIDKKLLENKLKQITDIIENKDI